MKLFTVAILAGGLATRLKPITEKIPKSLIEVAGKPFICHQLDYLRSQGVGRVVLCIGHLGSAISDVVGDGANWGIEVVYSSDGETLLGTGGAILKAIPLLGKNFFIIYGDSYLPINFKHVQNSFMSSEKLGLMTILKNENRWDKSNVIFKNKQIVLYEKGRQLEDMGYIDYGLGILKEDVFKGIGEEVNFDLANVYHQLSKNHELAAYEVFERFYEIGSKSGINETERYLLKKNER